jgi:hypothetical protein
LYFFHRDSLTATKEDDINVEEHVFSFFLASSTQDSPSPLQIQGIASESEDEYFTFSTLVNVIPNLNVSNAGYENEKIPDLSMDMFDDNADAESSTLVRISSAKDWQRVRWHTESFSACGKQF